MGTMNMHNLIQWFAANAGILAVVITAGVAVLLCCCLACSNCGCRQKDEIFKHHEI
jgi:hypothetical protein